MTESAHRADHQKRSSFSGLAVLIAGGALVLYLLAVTISEFLVRRPSVALLFNPSNASALLARANAALDEDPPDIESARRLAAAALRADPLVANGHRTLARVAEEANEEASAAALSRLAARFARDGEAQFSVLQRSLAAGDFDDVAHRLDLLFRGQARGRWPRIGQAFAGVVGEPRLAAAIARKLGEDPPWRQAFLGQSFARAAPIEALIAFYGLLPNPQDLEARLFLERLVRDKRYDVAHALFIRMLAPERLGEAGLLYNARFQYGASNMPFDWVMTPMPNTLTELRRDRNRRVLRVSFFGGRTPYRNVTHLMALAPGHYVFSGQEQALSLNTPRGLRWRVSCADTPDEALGASNLLAGDVPQRPFAISFDVPPTCPFQILQLELAARVALEQEATESALYSDLSLRFGPQGQAP